MKKILITILLSFIWGAAISAFTIEPTSCAHPSILEQAGCRRKEKLFLEATVRIQFHGFVEIDDGYDVRRVNGSLSHGTVIGGRYLLTHNHFGIRLSQALLFDHFGSGGFSAISVFDHQGVPVIEQAPVEAFSVIYEEGETVILDFGLLDGQGIFQHAGLISADLITKNYTKFHAGSEVAQIDSNGEGETIVVWTTIERLISQDRLSLVQVGHYISIGASGGGLFLDGRHIGNNWSRTLLRGADSGAELGRFSLVALNGPEIMQSLLDPDA